MDSIITNNDYTFDAIVVGAGHAGIEAALSLARMGNRTLCLSVTLDNAGYLACNPSIGGTAKGHLVREVDALGGEMGRAADTTLSQLRMLNSSKGPAVHSLRAQVDKYKYHAYMKSVLENEENLSLRQGEAKNIIVENGVIAGVETVTGLSYRAKAVVLACGVYLKSTIIVGSVIEERGPVCFPRANYLSESLEKEGFVLRRFKTGTPARVKKDSVNLEKLEIQYGEDTPYSFCALSTKPKKKDRVCYLGYTNENTHEVIRQNLQKSPKYSGLIHGTGARYCPSLEDKVVRFADKQRHQFFLEPEGDGTKEMYVQGLSTGLPADVQLQFYRTIEGFETLEIMRDAYAIEYECIDPLQLYPTLMSKKVEGLFFAGQINGTSGYEEAAAQGIVAGINAALYLKKKPPLILTRDSSYIGVLIDDLVTLGTNEPYRMMTSRAEFRLLLRQDNADLRLTPQGIEVGLVTEKRRKLYEKKKRNIAKAEQKLAAVLPMDKLGEYFEEIGDSPAKNAMRVEDVIKRNYVTRENFCAKFPEVFDKISADAVNHVFIETRYAGYLERERRAAEEIKRLENMRISPDTDFFAIEGLRIEAKEKLSAIRPLTVGQASRISGVTPADINVLIIRLKGLRQGI